MKESKFGPRLLEMTTKKFNVSKSKPLNLKEGTLDELGIKKLNLVTSSGKSFSFPEALKNGRSNYVIFENLIRDFTTLEPVRNFDHIDPGGFIYEQKSYKDPQLFPKSKPEFQCSASRTFGANNYGPKIKKLLGAKKYSTALSLCKELSYNEIDYFIFTNTSQWTPKIPLRFFKVSKLNVMKSLSKKDPRLVRLDALLALNQRTYLLF